MNICPFCLTEVVEGSFITLSCKHEMHTSCVVDYIFKADAPLSCPLCRHEEPWFYEMKGILGRKPTVCECVCEDPTTETIVNMNTELLPERIQPLITCNYSSSFKSHLNIISYNIPQVPHDSAYSRYAVDCVLILDLTYLDVIRLALPRILLSFNYHDRVAVIFVNKDTHILNSFRHLTPDLCEDIYANVVSEQQAYFSDLNQAFVEATYLLKSRVTQNQYPCTFLITGKPKINISQTFGAFYALGVNEYHDAFTLSRYAIATNGYYQYVNDIFDVQESVNRSVDEIMCKMLSVCIAQIQLVIQHTPEFMVETIKFKNNQMNVKLGDFTNLDCKFLHYGSEQIVIMTTNEPIRGLNISRFFSTSNIELQTSLVQIYPYDFEYNLKTQIMSGIITELQDIARILLKRSDKIMTFSTQKAYKLAYYKIVKLERSVSKFSFEKFELTRLLKEAEHKILTMDATVMVDLCIYSSCCSL